MGRFWEFVERGDELTEDAVREIRRRLAGGEDVNRLAAGFGVSQVTVSRAAHRRDWKQVEWGSARERVAGRSTPRRHPPSTALRRSGRPPGSGARRRRWRR